MKSEEVKSLLVMTLANYPNMQEKDLAPTLKLWREILGFQPYELVKNALKKVLETAKFFPSVAEIQVAIQSIKDDQRNTAFQPLKKTDCSVCGGGGFITVSQGGEDRYCRCPCKAGDRLSGWPMAPSWATQTDRSILQGQETGDIPF